MRAREHWALADELTKDICEQGTMVLASGEAPLGEVPPSGERLLVVFEAVSCRLRPTREGLELSWLAGAPDGEPHATLVEVLGWKMLAVRPRHHADVRCDVPNIWEARERVKYLNDKVVPEVIREELFYPSRRRLKFGGPWVEKPASALSDG